MIDLSRVRQSHRKFLSAHDAAVRDELNRARSTGIEYVKTSPGFTPRTGELQAATTGQVIRTSRGSLVRLENRKPYAAPIDKGSRAHVIRARNAGTLRFNVGGKLFFRRTVKHPGNKPYHFLRTATLAAGHTFGAGMMSRMRAISRQF